MTEVTEEERRTMVDIKLTVSVTAALLVGAVVGGLVGHYAVPSSDPVSSSGRPQKVPFKGNNNN